ncbi:M67 family metallopeptidase [Paenibacillus sp. UNC451MF]|uniref:M67 family metallopeptidase n=1 Tax=Paenibacillus sp. UNC451MF TaxID=1449063 RepID=UPI00048C300B
MAFSVTIPHTVKHEILKYCREQYPLEACGFLLGSVTDELVKAKFFVPIPNAAHDPLHSFSMDPASMLPYIYPMNDDVGTIIGILHSHPCTPAIPSFEDLQTAWLHIPTHWIVSLLKTNTPDVQVYNYDKYGESCVPFHSIPWSVDSD